MASVRSALLLGALLGWAVAMFLVFAPAMGLDFPGSDRRFARLASAN